MALINDVRAGLITGAGETAIVRAQTIPQEFLDDAKAARDGNHSGETQSVARLPYALVETWLREGFNVFDKNVDAAAIVRRLKAQGLDQFLTTTKRV